MTFGFCHLSIVPLRELPSDTSEMVSQLLFGDVFEILDITSDNWLHIRNSYDLYEGYIDVKQQIPIDSIDFISHQEPKLINKTTIEVTTQLGKLILPPGCSFQDKEYKSGGFVIAADGNISPFQPLKRDEIVEIAMSFLNTPYLWGGKTIFGVDCSGLTQTIFKTAGIKLQRDASQQAMQGESLNFIEEALPGDIAFFDNEVGQIIHVGIMLSDNEIIHASGRVRIDKIDHQGIFNEDMGKYSHQLRLIKRIVK